MNQQPGETSSATPDVLKGEAKQVKLSSATHVQAIKEWITHGLALAIVGSTIFCALWSFNFLGNADQMEDAKALLAVMSGLAGVVVGYYFGRVPADAHASRAQDQMQHMDRHMGRVDRQLEHLEEKAQSGTPVDMDDLRRTRQMINQS
jgi:hypothetical protein